MMNAQDLKAKWRKDMDEIKLEGNNGRRTISKVSG